MSFSHIQNYIGIDAPDSCKYDHQTERLIIHPEAVISRQQDGTVVSRYKDDIWDLSSYQGAKLYFYKTVHFGNDKETVKALCYSEFIQGGNSNGVNRTGIEFLHKGLCRIHKESTKYKVSLKTFLEDNIPLKALADSIEVTVASTYQTCLKKLMEHGEYVGINIKADSDRDKVLYAKMRIAKLGQRQTLVIPPDIYFNSYMQRWEHFTFIEKNIDKLSYFITQFTNDPYFGRNTTSKNRTAPLKLVPFKIAAQLCDVWKFMQHYKVSKAEQIEGLVSRILGTCANLISQATGMRNDELKLLRQGCFNQGTDERPPYLTGWEKKGNKGEPRAQDWIIHEDMERVVKVIQTLGKAMIEGMNLLERDKIPLFVHPSVVNDSYYRKAENVFYSELVIKNKLTSIEFPLRQEELIITKEMMQFLEKHHPPGRFHKDPKITIGKAWHFTSHQWRRSYAFYAMNSGMVSLTAISKQLAHGLAMAAHYTNGSANSQPFITDGDGHIAREIEKQRYDSEALSLVHNLAKNIARAPSVLQKWAKELITSHDVNSKDKESAIWKSKEETKKMMKKNKLFYRETSIGGCTTSEPCDAFLTFDFTQCGDCDHAHPVKSKIDRALNRAELSLLDLMQLGYSDVSKEIKTQIKEIEYFKTQKEKFTKDES